ncbi:MAG: hypothetical protein CSB44_00040 [Gammaproteobacteria bacterium]|nr:MAG: hypothetical protein CSB44_00040 [Gammaproteobacteria bacterium]
MSFRKRFQSVSRTLSRSLSLRMLAIFLFTAIAVLAILVELFSRGLGAQWQHSIQPHLEQYARYIQEDIGNPPDPERMTALAAQLPLDIHVFRGETLLASTTDRPFDPRHYRFRQGNGEAGVGTPRGPMRRPGRVLRLRRGDLDIYLDLRRGHHHAMNRHAGEPPRHHRDRDELWWSLLALFGVLGTSYWLIRRQLSPIRRIQARVTEMSAGNLDARIKPAGHSDLDELGRSIDDMAGHTRAMLDAKRELLLAISHELRSPLTRARLATEMLPPSRNRERLEDELGEMESLISDLIENERLQQAHAVLTLEHLELQALLTQEYTAVVGEPLQLAGHDIIEGDTIRLRLMIRNILNNALLHGATAAHSPATGDTDSKADPTTGLAEATGTIRGEGAADGHPAGITLTHEHTDGHHVIRVRDDGPGIAPDKLKTVLEPFYRLDESRTRTTGGFGLGLTLARQIAVAHGGSLSVANNDDAPGITVTITLPDTSARLRAV